VALETLVSHHFPRFNFGRFTFRGRPEGGESSNPFTVVFRPKVTR